MWVWIELKKAQHLYTNILCFCALLSCFAVGFSHENSIVSGAFVTIRDFTNGPDFAALNLMFNICSRFILIVVCGDSHSSRSLLYKEYYLWQVDL